MRLRCPGLFDSRLQHIFSMDKQALQQLIEQATRNGRELQQALDRLVEEESRQEQKKRKRALKKERCVKPERIVKTERRQGSKFPVVWRSQGFKGLDVRLPTLDFESDTFWADLMEMNQAKLQTRPHLTSFRTLNKDQKIHWKIKIPPWLADESETHEQYPLYFRACRRLDSIVSRVRRAYEYHQVDKKPAWHNHYFDDNLWAPEIRMRIARDLDKLYYPPETKREVAMEEGDCYCTCSQITRDMIAVYETGVLGKSGFEDQEEREYGRVQEGEQTQEEDSEESTDDSEGSMEELPVVQVQLSRKRHALNVGDYERTPQYANSRQAQHAGANYKVLVRR